MAEYFTIDKTTLKPSGDWLLRNISTIEAELKNLPNISKIDCKNLDGIDPSGAYLFTRNFPKAKFTNLSAAHKKIFEVIDGIEIIEPSKSKKLGPIQSAGKFGFDVFEEAKNSSNFVGEFFVNLIGVLLRPMRIRGTSITHHMMQAGIKAIPIVSLIAFLIAIVLVYQGAIQLRKFGADIFTVDLVGISVLREMGVLLTAVMVAGRSGSAFTAEIGMMKVNEEIDAMKTIGVSPFEAVVIPRVIALIIAMPLLTFIADIAGLMGGAFAANGLLDISLPTFMDRIQTIIKEQHFWVGIVKAPVFGVLIALTACYRGMQVSGSSESVGRKTTRSVVESIFLVFVADALFSILFVEMGI